jgi:hypothetical protein
MAVVDADTDVGAPLNGAPCCTAPAGGRVIHFSYGAMSFDPNLAAAVRVYRQYSPESAARLMLSWIVTDLDGVGDDDMPVWRALELLDAEDLHAMLGALAEDRRRVLAARLEDRRARGR